MIAWSRLNKSKGKGRHLWEYPVDPSTLLLRTDSHVRSMPLFRRKQSCPEINRDGTFELSEDCFDAFLAGNPKTVLMFYSPTCRHSLAMEPMFAGLRSDESREIAFCKVNVINKGLVQRYSVPGTPTFIFIRQGTTLSRLSGEVRREVLKAEVEKLLI